MDQNLAQCIPEGSSIPPLLFHAAAEQSAKIVLVIGAGCSYPAPTSVPMAQECAKLAYERLIRDGVLKDGDCSNPNDLSILADTVYDKRDQRQMELVERLPREKFRRARCNEGYLIVAALLRENVISSVLTLNYDLAIEHALNEVCASEVEPIAAPSHIANMKAHNVVYLHRNVNEADYEEWVIRASALDRAWKAGWEAAMAEFLLTSPVVVFAGLGNPAQVLIETITRIRNSLHDVATFQVDPADQATNAFSVALGLPEGTYIQLEWNEFAKLLGNRVCQAQLSELKQTCLNHIYRERLPSRELNFIFLDLSKLSIVQLGKLRANWILDETESYTPHSRHVNDMLADLVVAADILKEKTYASDVYFEDSIVEFRNHANKIIAATILVSGKGQRSWTVLEQAILERRHEIKRHAIQPTSAIISGATGRRLDQLVTPENVVFEGLPVDDIRTGTASFCFIDSREITENPNRIDSIL
jgi:hypothetical protein